MTNQNQETFKPNVLKPFGIWISILLSYATFFNLGSGRAADIIGYAYKNAMKYYGKSRQGRLLKCRVKSAKELILVLYMI